MTMKILLISLLLSVYRNLGYMERRIYPFFSRSLKICNFNFPVVVKSNYCSKLFGSKSGSTNCKLCSGKGAVNCGKCGGRGIDKKDGSVLERWTCKKCKGFGFVNCLCNPIPLTPEQRLLSQLTGIHFNFTKFITEGRGDIL